ncbi:MAG: glycerophosphodiester phosphodiesterase family protein [Acholeplasmataceae bacterium]|jgi:glycerophosphoryl diester phosphodiesterase|nr:glycerophosphodiester phosphodiesterase family protein [Acholeplasmataceae bacterium]
MKLIAHRGLSSIAPENTMSAFELAGKEQRFFGIECDIHETKDHQFVVMHDDNLSRMVKKDVLIKNLTLKELKKYVIKAGNNIKNYPKQSIPTFEEYLDLCVYYDKVAIIEIKEVMELSSLVNVMNHIDNHLGLRAVIISFNINYLKYMRALSETIELQLLTDQMDDATIYDARVNQIDLSIWHEQINTDRVKQLKKEGFKIAVFTVNDPKLQRKYASMGIDYLTTDT